MLPDLPSLTLSELVALWGISWQLQKATLMVVTLIAAVTAALLVRAR